MEVVTASEKALREKDREKSRAERAKYKKRSRSRHEREARERRELIQKIQSEINRLIPLLDAEQWSGRGFKRLARGWRPRIAGRSIGHIASNQEMGNLSGYLAADHCIYMYEGRNSNKLYCKVRLRGAEVWKLENILKGLQAI